MNEKYRKVAIMVAIILGAGGVLYVGGLFSQLMTNYQVWMDSGGMWGNALMAAPSWNPLICFLKAFTWNGLKGMALLLAAIAGVYLYVRFHDKITGTHYDERGFVVSKTGTYGTASWMTEKELKAVLELSTADKATGMILGERKSQLVCLPENTRLNRHCAIFGASGTMKSRAVIRNALFSVIRRGESAIISDPKSEMYNDMSELFRQNGYEVKVFNLVDPTHSDSWNCMANLGSDTLVDDAHVFTYAMELTKLFSDGNGDYAKVEFIMQNDTDGYFVKAELNEAEGIYYVVDHMEAEADATHFIPVENENGEGLVIVKGLEDDSYTVTEVRTDNGYTLLKDDIEIVISQVETIDICDIYASDVLGLIQNDPRYATIINDTGDLKNMPQKHLEHHLLTASATVDGNKVNMLEDDGSVNASVPLKVVNTRGFDLPQTGDNGTWMFSVIGILMMAGAACFILVLTTKKRTAEE